MIKKTLAAIITAGFIAISLVPATAATKATMPMAQHSKMTSAKGNHKIGNPAKKLAKGVKKDVHKMDKAVKRTFTKKHKTATSTTTKSTKS